MDVDRDSDITGHSDDRDVTHFMDVRRRLHEVF